ncbi:hypothetical protein AAG906_019726 [Vitis piasezkii]
MPSLQDIESMMVGIDDMEEFKWVFLIFASNLIDTHISFEGSHSLWRKESVWIKGCLMFLQIFYFSISNFSAMYVELTTPRIAAWNDFLVKQRIKLELEMLGGFGKVEHIGEQDETEKIRLLQLMTKLTLMRMKTLMIPSPGPHNMLVLVQSCMNNNVDIAPQASRNTTTKSKMKVRRHRQRAAALTEEETHVVDYVFDESKDPRLSYIVTMLSTTFYGNMWFNEQVYLKINTQEKIRSHLGMYVILYMQHWDGSGLNRTINYERMSLERLKFAIHMVLDSENKIGEMVTTNILSTNDAK